jgi:prepilin-type processing-associated H-X9-DG protein
VGCRLAQKRHRQGYNALYLDWHVGYLNVQPDDPEFKQKEIKLWDITQ